MDAILSTIQQYAATLKSKGLSVLDSVFPPEKRAELLSRLQTFVMTNPKLSFFLLTNFALTGVPLGLFALFTLTVLIFSIVVALVIALLVAVLFTVFMVGVALLILLPTVFMTTLAASFITLWGLGGYYIIKWFNQGDTPAISGESIGAKLSSLTGGSMDSIMDGARQNFNSITSGFGGEKPAAPAAPEQQANGSAGGDEPPARQAPAKLADRTGAASNATGAATNAGQTVQKTAAGGASGVTNKVGGTLGTAKGAVGGATGLA